MLAFIDIDATKKLSGGILVTKSIDTVQSQFFPKRYVVEVIQCYRGMEFENLKCFYECEVGVKVLKGQNPIFSGHHRSTGP